jgi:cleavage and polyadenylation specificity factor subunit 2
VRKAKLQDNLYDKIQFFYSEADKYHLARIDATVSVSGEDGESSVFWLDAPEAKVDSNGRPAAQGTVRPVTMVGDLKLSVLAGLLNEKGVDAHFKNGVLVCCQGRVMLQKSAAENKIEMHGALCADYYTIKDLLYSQFDMF